MSAIFIEKSSDDTVRSHSWHLWSSWALSLNPMDELLGLERSDSFKCYPELVALVSCPQDPIWHPEGDVWAHTKLVVGEAARIAVERSLSPEERLTLLFSALCHDFGKPHTTTHEADGRI